MYADPTQGGLHPVPKSEVMGVGCIRFFEGFLLAMKVSKEEFPEITKFKYINDLV